MPHLEYTDEELGLKPNWDLDPDSGQRLSPVIREQLRRSHVVAKENADLRTKVEAQERVESFRRAGIPADPRGDLFAKAYDGPSDPDSVKAAFESTFGKLDSSTEGNAAGGASNANDAAERRVLDAGASGAGSGGAPGDTDFALAMEQAWQEGGNEGLKKFIASNGDVRFDYEGRQVGIKLPDID